MLIDLVGKEFGPFEVICRDVSKNMSNTNGKAAYWICKCNLCGSSKSYRSDILRKRCPGTCGCAAIRITPGERFGHLIVVKRHFDKPSRSCHWICKCDCGKEIIRTSSYLKTYSNGSCGCFHNPSGMDNPAFKGCGELYASIFNRIKRGAVRRNLNFNIAIEDLWQLYQKQNGKCAISGLPISFGKLSRINSKPCTASLNRILSENGYVKNNVQWVHKDVNIMKNKLSQSKFVELCKTISKYNT